MDILLQLKKDKGYALLKRNLELERERLSKPLISDLHFFFVAWSLSGIYLFLLFPQLSNFIAFFLISTLTIVFLYTHHQLEKGHTHYHTHQYYLRKYIRDQVGEIP